MDKDKNDENKNNDDIADIFHDIGRDFSRLIERIAKDSESQFGSINDIENLDDLGDLSDMKGFDFDKIQDFMEQFNFGPGSFDDFDPGSFNEKNNKRKKKREEPETRKPNVDVFEEDDTIEVFAELPGIAEEKISISIQGSKLNLEAGGKSHKFKKEIILPTSKIGAVSKKLNNGILHITLHKEN